MSDLSDVEKKKNEELARLKARHAELESSARMRKDSFLREMEQLKDFMQSSIKNLEAAFAEKENLSRSELERSGSAANTLEERLAQISREADPAALEKKLKSIEEGFLADVAAAKPSEFPQRLQEEFSANRKEAEARIAAKASEIAVMEEKLKALESEAVRENGEFEESRRQMIEQGRQAIAKREEDLRAALSELDRELALRRLRMEELENLISARETWVKHEKTKRIERIRSLAAELDRHAELLEEKIDQEKAFWNSQLAETTREAETLNARLATFQAEIQALKTQHRQELQESLVRHKKEQEAREAAVRQELEQWRQNLHSVNSRIQEVAGRFDGLRSGYQKEMQELESSFKNQKTGTEKLIESREEELLRLREGSGAELERRTAELQALRLEYERKILTPVLEEKGRHLNEIEKQKKDLEEALAKKEEEHRREIGRVSQECGMMEARFVELEKAQEQEAREHQKKLQALREQAAGILAPLNEKIGNLSKALELVRKKHSAEMERLENEKSNLQVEVDHKRIAFESAVEEKRKEMLFTIENLKASQEGSAARWMKEKKDREETRGHLQREVERLEKDLTEGRAGREKNLEDQKRAIEESQAGSLQEIERLKSAIVETERSGKDEAERLKTELAQAEASSRNLIENLTKSWEKEELELEKQRIEWMDGINKITERQAADKSGLEAEIQSLSGRLSQLQERSRKDNEQWETAFRELQERRASLLGPLETELENLRRQKEQVVAKNKVRSKELRVEMEKLEADLEKKRAGHAQEIDLRRQALAQALKELRDRRKEQEKEFSHIISALTQEKQGKQEHVRILEAEMEKTASAHRAKRDELAGAVEQDRARLEQSLAESRKELAEIREGIENLEASQAAELERIEAEVSGSEEAHRARLSKIEETHRKETADLESKTSQTVQVLEKEIQELTASNESQSAHVKELQLETDVLKSRREVELAELERQKRRLAYELRSQRGELARELRLARRSYQDKLKEREHDLYLARVKMQVRAKRLDELAARKKEELAALEQAAQVRIVQTVKNLESQVLAQRERREKLMKRAQQLESEQSGLKQGSSRHSEETKSAEREKELMRRRAKAKLDVFIAHMEEVVASKEEERVRLMEMVEQMGPLGENLQRSLTGLAMDWEREMRRMENFLKGLEESPFWGQH